MCFSSQIGVDLPPAEQEIPKADTRRLSKAKNFFAYCSPAALMQDIVDGQSWIDANQFAAINCWASNNSGPQDTDTVFAFFMELAYSWRGAAEYVTNIEGDAKSVKIKLRHNVPAGKAFAERIRMHVLVPKMARLIMWLIIKHFPVTVAAGKKRGVLCPGAGQALEVIHQGTRSDCGTPFELYERFIANYIPPSRSEEVDPHVGPSSYRVLADTPINDSAVHARFFAVISTTVGLTKNSMVRKSREVRIKPPISRHKANSANLLD